MRAIAPVARLAKFARSTYSLIHHAFYAMQPWYDWGRTSAFRLDAITEAEMTEGLVRYAEIQWFGVHLGLIYGRTPAKAVSRGAA